MLHFSEKNLELQCTLESQTDAPVLHQMGVNVWKHPRSLLGLGSAEVAISTNAEWVMLGRLQYNNSVSAQRLLCGACLASHSLHFSRALAAMVPHGESTYEVLHIWKIGSCCSLVRGAGSCHPYSYSQLELLPWAVYQFEFPCVQGWYNLWQAGWQKYALETCRVFIAANRTEKLTAAFTAAVSGSCVNAQARGVGSGTALRWL